MKALFSSSFVLLLGLLLLAPGLASAADPTKAALLGTHREYLTTSDVARIEQVSVREVQDMIVNGEIQPAPVKDGREYRIAASYRIQPQPAADCGEQPQ